MELRQSIQIPQRDYAVLKQLFNLSDDDTNRLVALLKKGEPSSSMSEYVASITRDGSGFTNLALLVRLLVNLYQLRNDLELPVPEFIEVILLALERASDDDLRPQNEKREQFVSRLSTVLSLPEPLGVVAKAAFLRSQFGRTLHYVGVATDIRPIFEADINLEPKASLVVHRLSIQYHDGSGLEDLLLELTTNDLLTLQRVIERALRKDASTRALLNRTGITVVGSGK